MSSKYVVGGYFGNPNGNDAASEADFENQFNSFVTTMGGAKPATMNAFVDFSHDPSTWAANAGWTAWSWTQSPVVKTSITPDIGIPMSDNSHWQGNAAGSTNDDFFKNIINGTYDGAYKGVVDAWANAGFKTFSLRLGYEMNGTFMPWFMGSDTGTQADWVKAFQHLSTLMRGEAATDGVTAKIEWNPNNQGWSNQSVVNTYPGDAYVDTVSLDTYSPVYPNGLYNWDKNDGSYNANATEWAADPVNRAHFWSYPDANQWNPTGTGAGFGMEDAIAFAKAHGKALAISESGAGGNGTTTGPVDDPAFPQWLASELDKAQSQGVAIDHVDIWDRQMGDGNWDFSPAANKPLEAAAWAKYFGANSGTASSPATAPASVGTGADTLVLELSEDAYQGDAQFTVSVDGKQVGGTQSITASHANGQTQAFTFKGDFGIGKHAIAVNFLNDAWGGTAATDRNLYVDEGTLDGNALQGGGEQAVTGAINVTGVIAATGNPDTLVLGLSEDAYQGDAQCIISIDGKTVGGTVTVTASHAQGKAQTVSLSGQWGPGAHDVGVQFINDAWGGTATTDRNLYVNGVSLDGQVSTSASVAQMANGTAHLTTGASPFVLQLSEDAYQGDAQFTVSVDGKTLGGAQTVTASHGAGAVQNFAFAQAMTAGTHEVAVSFLNDAWGGTAATDRNLYVNAVDANGAAMPGTAATLTTTSTQHFSIVVAAQA